MQCDLFTSNIIDRARDRSHQGPGTTRMITRDTGDRLIIRCPDKLTLISSLVLKSREFGGTSLE